MGIKTKYLRKIWELSPHNALTDLCRYRDGWFCAFREGEDHISPGGCIRVITSRKGNSWKSAARLSMPGADLRDPKLSITPSGLMMLNAAAAYNPPDPHRHQSFVWFSENGVDWSSGTSIGEPNYWLWRVTWSQGIAYGIGYCTVGLPHTKLYASNDGIQYRILVPDLFDQDGPNECTIRFRNDQSAICLLRRDFGSATAMLGLSAPGYYQWEWRDLGVRIGGPNLLILPDGRIVAAFRRDIKTPWTSLNWLDATDGRLTEFLALPSGGDTSYPGLCWYDGLLWVSYYSSHEGHASIYLARIEL